MYRKEERDDKERMVRNRPEKKRLGNHFLTAECFAHAPRYEMESWCLPLHIPQDRIETLEQIRRSLSQFNAYTKWLTDGERAAAWQKLTAAAKKYGITVSTPVKNTSKPVMPPMPPRLTASHRMTVNW